MGSLEYNAVAELGLKSTYGETMMTVVVFVGQQVWWPLTRYTGGSAIGAMLSLSKFILVVAPVVCSPISFDGGAFVSI